MKRSKVRKQEPVQSLARDEEQVRRRYENLLDFLTTEGLVLGPISEVVITARLQELRWFLGLED